jgi:hypothetical protein
MDSGVVQQRCPARFPARLIVTTHPNGRAIVVRLGPCPSHGGAEPWCSFPALKLQREALLPLHDDTKQMSAHSMVLLPLM